MGGWNLLYGILNFLILAAVIYFAGRKIIIKMFRDRRDRVVKELN